MKTTKTAKEEKLKFIDEARLDDNKRAKDTMDYEQMLMAFIENELRGDTH